MSGYLRPATEVFSEWAEKGKDLGMERGHAPAVGEILAVTLFVNGKLTLEPVQ